MSEPRISVVVPALDEEAELGRNLPRLLGLEQVHEVVVADGGSRDRTREVAEEHGARVVSSAPGRGTQMNAGARAAAGDHLLFLHADSWLSADALEGAAAALTGDAAAAVFRQRIEGRHPAYRLIERAAARRAVRSRRPYGDSGLFVRRDLFEAVGGYPEVPLCEDLGLARRLAGRGPILLLPGVVHLSARRWEARGVLATTLLNWWVAWQWRRGVPPERLYRRYYGRALGT